MITLSNVGTASRTMAISLATAAQSPACAAPRSMTMSTSTAPSSTARRASIAFVSAWCAPDGKPTTHAVAIDAGSQPEPSGSIEGETHTAKTERSAASRQSSSTSARVASGLRSVWSIILAIESAVVIGTSSHGIVRALTVLRSPCGAEAGDPLVGDRSLHRRDRDLAGDRRQHAHLGAVDDDRVAGCGAFGHRQGHESSRRSGATAVHPLDELLPRVAALREADGAVEDPRLAGDGLVVDLDAHRRPRHRDPPPLEVGRRPFAHA